MNSTERALASCVVFGVSSIGTALMIPTIMKHCPALWTPTARLSDRLVPIIVKLKKS